MRLNVFVRGQKKNPLVKASITSMKKKTIKKQIKGITLYWRWCPNHNCQHHMWECENMKDRCAAKPDMEQCVTKTMKKTFS